MCLFCAKPCPWKQPPLLQFWRKGRVRRTGSLRWYYTLVAIDFFQIQIIQIKLIESLQMITNISEEKTMNCARCNNMDAWLSGFNKVDVPFNNQALIARPDFGKRCLGWAKPLFWIF
jgi:hypothetical protein